VTGTWTTLNRVAEPTASFWVIKILTTGMGEALSDRLVTRFDPVPMVLITAVVFVVVLTVQFRSRRFSSGKYWSAVAMVAVFGTIVADVAHVVAGIPYLVPTLVVLEVACVFVGGMAAVVALRRANLLGPVAAFLSAYVLTRPVGSSIADWLAVSPLRGGLGYGTGMVSVIALLAIVIAVAITSDRLRRGRRTSSDG
jgi:uncharacterized membrane-anchored protein